MNVPVTLSVFRDNTLGLRGFVCLVLLRSRVAAALEVSGRVTSRLVIATEVGSTSLNVAFHIVPDPWPCRYSDCVGGKTASSLLRGLVDADCVDGKTAGIVPVTWPCRC